MLKICSAVGVLLLCGMGCVSQGVNRDLKAPHDDGAVQEDRVVVAAPDPYPAPEQEEPLEAPDPHGVVLAGTTGASADYASVQAIEGKARREVRKSVAERLEAKRQEAVEERSAEPQAQSPAPEPAVPDTSAIEAESNTREILYAGAMQLAVFDVAASKDEIEAQITSGGGYVQSIEGNEMVVRVPAKEFRRTMAQIGSLGRVVYQAIRSRDVSEEYEDLETRIEVMRRTQAQLLKLLDRARTVQEALQVRAQLDKLTLELERALGRQRRLASRLSFSILVIALTERGEDTYSKSNDPFPWVDSIGVEKTKWR